MPNTAAPLLPPSPAIAGPVGLTGVRSPIEPGASRTDARIGLLGTLVIVAGLLLALSGAGTWAMVQTSLAGESITVAEDAARFGGEPVDGPLTPTTRPTSSSTTRSRRAAARPTPSSTARTPSGPPS
jgi:hypothetical protein